MARLTMAQAKTLGVKAAGQEFECEKSAFYGGGPTGAIGTILPELSVHGKLQAVLTCTEAGCTNTHVREVSDWHQCTKCEEHRKVKAKGSGAGKGLNYGRSVKLDDGTILREMKVSEKDDAETVALKTENNELFEQLFAIEQANLDAAKVAAKAEREAKAQAARDAKELATAAERKVKAQAALELARKIAAERGIKVSPKLEAEAS